MNSYTLEEFKEKYVPKKYHEAIEDFEYDSLDKYWLYLKEGYISSSTGNRTIHEYTIKDIRNAVKTIKKV